jgi:GDP-L-fucose synthase
VSALRWQLCDGALESLLLKKVVVLGGTGFLGSHVVRKFADQGYRVESCSRSTGIDARHEEPLRSFLEKSSPDIFVHCAQNGGGIGYNATHPIEIFEDNLRIGFYALKSAADAGVKKFVNIMGNSTFPRRLTTYEESEWWNGPADESVVASSLPRKANWVQAWAYKQERGFHSVHLVLPNMYGPGDHLDPSRSHALMALVRKVSEAKQENRSAVEIWGSGTPIREWLYVEDAAEGIVRATEQYDDIEILNIGSGIGCSILALAEMIKELLGWNGRFVCDSSRPDGAPIKIFDVSKMKNVLGWEPRTKLRDGLMKTIEWLEESQRKNNRGARTLSRCLS